MELPRRSTEKMYQILHQDDMNMQDISLIMGEMRCLIEDNGMLNQKLRLLHFYCDWCLHSQIERQGHCEAFIRDLNKTLWQLDESGSFAPKEIIIWRIS